MYIETETATARLSVERDGETFVAEFTDEGRARVRAEVGEVLADEFDAISIADREDETDDADTTEE
jgi:hypothetical protein